MASGSFRITLTVEQAEAMRRAFESFAALREPREIHLGPRIAEMDRGYRNALERSEFLLKEHLTREQRGSLSSEGSFVVHGNKGGTYRITQRPMVNIDRLENGEVIDRLCIELDGVPRYDRMLAQKLWLETDEEHALAVANHYSPSFVTRLG